MQSTDPMASYPPIAAATVTQLREECVNKGLMRGADSNQSADLLNVCGVFPQGAAGRNLDGHSGPDDLNHRATPFGALIG